MIKVKQGNHLPYFIVRAIGIENEEDAEYLDEDDYWNSLSHHYRNSKKNYFLLLNRKSKRWKICIQQIVEEMLLVMVHLLD